MDHLTPWPCELNYTHLWKHYLSSYQNLPVALKRCFSSWISSLTCSSALLRLLSRTALLSLDVDPPLRLRHRAPDSCVLNWVSSFWVRIQKAVFIYVTHENSRFIEFSPTRYIDHKLLPVMLPSPAAAFSPFQPLLLHLYLSGLVLLAVHFAEFHSVVSTWLFLP